MADRRLFIAVWPEAPLAHRLAALSKALHVPFGGRCMPLESLHLTLAFLGATPEARIPAITDALQTIEWTAFEWVLDHYGIWQSGIAWLGGPPCGGLLALADAVRRQLDSLAVAYDRKRFKPHLTLLRNVKHRADFPALAPLRWQVDRFVLVESITDQDGAHYRELVSFRA